MADRNPPAPRGARAAAAAAAAAAAPPRPARIAGDWTDNRTPPAELYFPSVVTTQSIRGSAQAPTAHGQRVRGVANVVPITYGNRVGEVTNFLNSKDVHPPPATRKANVQLPSVNRTMAQALVIIIDLFHYLAIQTISGVILAKKSITGKHARPLPHVVAAKTHVMSQLIKVMTFGVDCAYDSLYDAQDQNECIVSAQFVDYAMEFVTTRLNSVNYRCQWTITELRTANWDYFLKSVKRRSKFGIWSNNYTSRLAKKNRVTRGDAHIVKGVFLPVAIYCYKLIPEVSKQFDGKPMHCDRDEYVGDNWDRLVGDPLYARETDYDTDNTTN